MPKIAGAGEAVGVIVVEKRERDGNEEDGECREILAGRPSVSVRRGIAWGTNAATESTSTLVLTSSRSYFIDIRFSLLGPTPTSPPHYWAFAGVSTSTFPAPNSAITSTGTAPPSPPDGAYPVSFPCSIHTSWTRYVDSRGDLTSPDSGTTYLLHNGDCLEVGEMTNPETGSVQAYQELWTQPPELDVGASQTAAAAGEAGEAVSQPPKTKTDTIPSLKSKPKPRPIVTVALFHRSSPSTTSPSPPSGLILRLGPYCQGIISLPPPSNTDTNQQHQQHQTQHQNQSHHPTSVLVERWTLSAQVWHRDPRSDYTDGTDRDVWMPCLWVCGAGTGAGTVTGTGMGMAAATAIATATTDVGMATERTVGEWIERDGVGGRWTVVEVEV